MPTEMGGEAVEIITMAVDKFQAKKNYEVRYQADWSHSHLLSSCSLTVFCVILDSGGRSTHQKYNGQKVWVNMALCDRRRIWI
jgi:hypothetical protein